MALRERFARARRATLFPGASAGTQVHSQDRDGGQDVPLYYPSCVYITIILPFKPLFNLYYPLPYENTFSPIRNSTRPLGIPLAGQAGPRPGRRRLFQGASRGARSAAGEEQEAAREAPCKRVGKSTRRRATRPLFQGPAGSYTNSQAKHPKCSIGKTSFRSPLGRVSVEHLISWNVDLLVCSVVPISFRKGHPGNE